ncbi:MAG: GNAT family N-acetyltransferase [Rikenellaceae bacterium]|nr:GNAT family N-acetyltransferase [Rikenellaceae bacterium]
MKPLIEPVSRELIEAELTPERFLRNTNNAGNMIYVVTAADSPNTMREIGRLREWAFRDAGGGTGQQVDIDELDTIENGYNQLVVWDPDEREIVGGYRYIVSRSSHTPNLSTEHYFRFSDRFRKEILPYTIELGRSFVQPHYQGTRQTRKGVYALDNLWDGLGALLVGNPDMKYFFGKVTMYGDYNRQARDILIYFLRKYFPDTENLVEPIHPIQLAIDEGKMARIFTGADFAEDYKILSREIRALNENVPPLINSYMSLSPTMRVFGTVCNPDFGDVEETGILITIEDIYPKKSERHTKNL